MAKHTKDALLVNELGYTTFIISWVRYKLIVIVLFVISYARRNFSIEVYFVKYIWKMK